MATVATSGNPRTIELNISMPTCRYWRYTRERERLAGGLSTTPIMGIRRLPKTITIPNSSIHLCKRAVGVIRAVISRNGSDRTVNSPPPPSTNMPPIQNPKQEINAVVDVHGGDRRPATTKSIKSRKDDHMLVTATLVIRNKYSGGNLSDKVDSLVSFFVDGIGIGIGESVFLRLVSEQIDPVTKGGKVVESTVKKERATPSLDQSSCTVKYFAEFSIPRDFGSPGALLITNNHRREFYLVEIVLDNFEGNSIVFAANSWIQPTSVYHDSRIIFRNRAYLPSQTPSGIRALRCEDLHCIRGNGQGQRKLHERVYDYASYNDLGDPNEDLNLTRPVLAGQQRPYPRRCRTGRPANKFDPESESRVEIPDRYYIPRDEDFEEIKHATFSAGRRKGMLHSFIPQIAAKLSNADIPFKSFADIDKLYSEEGSISEEQGRENPLKDKLLNVLVNVTNKLPKYGVPAIVQRDKLAWMRDGEFARQALAGLNPVTIELLKGLPILSNLDETVHGCRESAITKEVLERELSGVTVEEAISNKRLFMIDYHDLLLPFVNKINSCQDRKCYASRTIFYLSDSGILKPILIELSLPPTSDDADATFCHVYTPGPSATEHWLWNLAKAHVCAIDSGVHQLAHHWLRTHACVEPYIIATHRCLSSMHPIYKLLHPHLRYTMEINALARQRLINGGGIIEYCFTPGKYAMEISSAAYKSLWRFDMEALPADLIRRGMAEKDPLSPFGIRLVIEDYPYAADGLLIWSALKEWVESYVSHFYTDDTAVSSDVELQEWWGEIKNRGHADKKDEPWWPILDTRQNLTFVLTTMIWTASAQHAALNFGQYPYGGYVLGRPALMRELIPHRGEPAVFEKFLLNPQLTFLSSLPSQLQATKLMAVQESLSTHSPDEEYLGGQVSCYRIDDNQVLRMFDRFSRKIKEVEEVINQRNRDPQNVNRNGAGIHPYELLLPSSGPGVTARGIPNSASI